jgi:uncharacterized protein (DUF433 family)
MPVGYSTVLMKTRYEHIVSNEDPCIQEVVGTALRVAEQQAHGWSPEELHFQHPYLALGQIHSTLAYYLDHREELDRDIQRRIERVEGLRRDVQPSLLFLPL